MYRFEHMIAQNNRNSLFLHAGILKLIFRSKNIYQQVQLFEVIKPKLCFFK